LGGRGWEDVFIFFNVLVSKVYKKRRLITNRFYSFYIYTIKSVIYFYYKSRCIYKYSTEWAYYCIFRVFFSTKENHDCNENGVEKSITRSLAQMKQTSLLGKEYSISTMICIYNMQRIRVIVNFLTCAEQANK